MMGIIETKNYKFNCSSCSNMPPEVLGLILNNTTAKDVSAAFTDKEEIETIVFKNSGHMFEFRGFTEFGMMSVASFGITVGLKKET